MEDKYYIIHRGEDSTSVSEVSKEELLNRIDPSDQYYGDVGFLDSITDTDVDYWGDNILIIKGSIVTPTEKKIVTKYDI